MSIPHSKRMRSVEAIRFLKYGTLSLINILRPKIYIIQRTSAFLSANLTLLLAMAYQWMLMTAMMFSEFLQLIILKPGGKLFRIHNSQEPTQNGKL
jgi:hypothetical protein